MIKGFFGGSYNPVHNGHIELARAVVAHGLADKVMMVLSPLNPLKENPEALIADSKRLEMLRLACEPYPELEVCDIELSMPRPSYTIDTLRLLSSNNPSTEYRLIIGADNWDCFRRWRSWEELLQRYSPIVYPREGSQLPQTEEDGLDCRGDDIAAVGGATFLRASLLPISSTQVRRMIAAGQSVGRLVPPAVEDYILKNSLYSK